MQACIAIWFLACTAHAATLHIPATSTASNQTAALRIPAHAGIVGLQFDLYHGASQVTVGAPYTGGTNTDHRVESRLMGSFKRVVEYSPTNQALRTNVVVNLPLELGAGAPAGGPTLLVRNVIFTDADGNGIPASLQFTPLDAWRQQHFTDTEITANGLVGDLDDPDGDGQPNLWEYATGGLPRLVTVTGKPDGSASDGPGGRRLHLTFRQSRSSLPDVTLVAETAAEVAGPWQPDPAVAVAPTGVADAQSVEFQASVEMTGGKQFLRLGFRRAP